MPELPEVQTVLDTLAYQMKHPVITDVEVFWDAIVHGDRNAFIQGLRKKRIERYERLGKYLCFDLGDAMWIAHLRMEGKFYLQQPQEPYDHKHVHVIFHLDDGRQLRYHDTRKFGKMYLYEKRADVSSYPCFKNIGYDAFDERITAEWMYHTLHKKKTALKAVLLDQRYIAGIGNIYADEICFAMHMHPETMINHLRKKDFEELIYHIRRILNGAIRAGGTTIRSYTSQLGVDGRFQLKLKVHAKKGEACPVCGTTIKKIVVATRGTCFCPTCQRRR